MEQTTTCSKCNKELPLTNEYFTKDSSTKNGFASRCKICKGDAKSYGISKSFIWTDELEKLFIELHFKHTHQYIVDNYKEFSGQTKKKLEDKLLRLRKKYPDLDLYKKDSHRNLQYEFWTDEQVNELIKIYPHMTNEDIVKLENFKMFTIEKVKNKINRLNKENGTSICKTKEVISKSLSNGQERHRKFLIENGIKRKYNLSENQRKIKSENARIKWSGDNNPRHKNPLFGSDNGRWVGGVKPTTSMLRELIYDWKYETMKSCNFKCVVTGEKFERIHHLYPFHKIMKECFERLGMDFKNTIEYSDCELETIRNEFIKTHNKYGLGVCLKEDIHIEFHKIYGYQNFTKQDFFNFCLEKYSISLE